jgi:uncharacterized membrane protein
MSADQEIKWTAWKAIMTVEWAALLMALFLPITPSKTGGSNRVGHYFFEEPTYLHEVLVSFILTNLMIGVLVGLIFLVAWYRKRRGGGSVGDAES